MSYVIVDVESDGPIPAEFSMVCFGAVIFDDLLDKTFYGKTRPIADRFVPESLAVSGFSREQHICSTLWRGCARFLTKIFVKIFDVTFFVV